MKISIKIGSNLIEMNITRTTCSKELVKMALLQSKIFKLQRTSCFRPTQQIDDKLLSNYSLFERALGVERQVKDSENVLQLWHRINRYNAIAKSSNIQLVIKKVFSKTNKSNVSKATINTSKRYFELYKKHMAQIYSNHIYEQIDISVSVSPKKQNKRTKQATNFESPIYKQHPFIL